MSKKIAHQGVVTTIDGQHVQVRIVQTSACAGCKVAGHCRSSLSARSSESKEKLIDVLGSDCTGLKVGDEVTVTATASMAGRALLVGFGMPLVLMLLTLVIALAAGCNEALAALLMVGVLIPYYIIIALLRDRLAKTIVFTIEK